MLHFWVSLFLIISIIFSNVCVSWAQSSIQDNLYKHTNSEWLSQTILPANLSYYDDDIGMNSFAEILNLYSNNFSKLRENSNMYKAVCVYKSLTDYDSRNVLGMSPLYPYFNKIDSVSSYDDFINICSEFQKNGFEILNLEYTMKNKYPCLRLIDFNLEFYYENSYNSNYKDYLKNLFKNINANNTDTIVDDIVVFEKTLAKYSEKNHYNEIKGSGFQTLMKESKTNNFVDIFKSDFLSKIGVKSNALTDIEDDLICQLQIIRKTDLQLLKNWLKLSLLRYSAAFLTKDVEDDWLLHKGYYDLSQDYIITKILQGSMGFNRLYGKALIENVSPEDKKFSKNVFNRVKEQYTESLDNLNLRSKSLLKKYINNIKILYGIPIDFQNGISFPELSLTSPLKNILKLNAFNNMVCVSKLNKSLSFNTYQENLYLLANVDPNMAYDSMSHSIIFCPLIFNSSRYNSSLSQTEKWLTLAFTIGHEIGHSIDSQNIPNLEQRFDLCSSDVEILSKVFRPISSQIQSYSINIQGKSYTMNPTRVLFEAVADLYGVEMVVNIIKKDKNTTLDEFFKVYSKMRRSIETDEKLKSIIQKEFYPVNEYRVNKTVSNLYDLYDMYGIGRGDEMYLEPEKRALIN